MTLDRITQYGLRGLYDDAADVKVYRRRHYDIDARIVGVNEIREPSGRWYVTFSLLFDNHEKVNVRVYRPKTPRIDDLRLYLDARVTKVSPIFSYRQPKSLHRVIIVEWLGTEPSEDRARKLESHYVRKSNVTTTADREYSDAREVRTYYHRGNDMLSSNTITVNEIPGIEVEQ